MKIIDFEKKGNVVRFYLGDNDLEDWGGDDWDDSPYDCNASEVYDEYVKGYADVYFSIDMTVLEPAEDYHYTNCPYSKDDMKNGKVPCIIATDDEYAENCFGQYCGSKHIVKFYFGDELEIGRYMVDERFTILEVNQEKYGR